MAQSGEKWVHMFRGSSNHTIDGKGRIIIPSRFRDQFDTNNGDAVALMITRLDDCLFAYALKDWIKIEERIVSLSETSDKMRAFRRFFIGGAYECFCDKQGRVLIPPTLRKYADLQRDIVLVGALEYFEIWSQERWNKADMEMGNALQDESMRNDIAKLGL